MAKNQNPDAVFAAAVRARVSQAYNTLRERLGHLVGVTHGGGRDMYSVFGYPREVTPDMLYEMYLRGGIASRIIRAFPQATWREHPVIRDEAGNSYEEKTPRGDKNPNYSPFVEAVDKFFEEHNVWRTLERADRLSGIGRFGILLLGFRDARPLSEPIRGKPKLAFISAYGEPQVKVTRWELNPKSPRFGLPVEYQIDQDFRTLASGAPSKTTINVHWSRVIHIAEFVDSDDAFGVPRLLPAYNHLLDLEKVVGGAAETFWLAANRGLALWADAEANLTEEDFDVIKKQADEFQHQLRRILVGSGMTAQVLGSDSPDPGPNADRLIDLIAGTTGIPKRILLGTERGELSSIQDENNWSARVDERRKNFITPMILRPLVQKLIDTGNLPAPQGMFWVEWPEAVSLDPVQRSQVASNRSASLANYVRSPGAELVVPPQEFRKEFLGLEPESEYELEESLFNDLDDPGVEDESEFNVNLQPRTLYVRRDVVNVGDIKRWAKAQGLKNIVKDLHVTILYCRKPVDWMKVGSAGDEMIIPRGGPRLVEEFNGGAIVLEFSSDQLKWRHEELKECTGAEHGYPEYRPHITITYTKPDFDISKIKPYTGEIVLGPEIFEEVDDEA